MSRQSPARGRLTVAAVVADGEAARAVERLGALGEALAHDWEVVVVAMGLAQDEVIALTQAVCAIPDATLHLLDDTADRDAATLAALDMSIGDRILLVEPEEAEAEAARVLLEASDDGFDVVFGRGAEGAARLPPFYRASRRCFAALYAATSGVRITFETPAMCLYSRAAALHLLSRREAEMLLRTPELGSAFPGTTVQIESRSERCRSGRMRRRGSMLRAYRALNRTGSLPLRVVILLCVSAATVNILYMIFAVVSSFYDETVAPGWTTLSLQIAGMFMLISIILGIMTEHIIELDRAVNRRPRYRVLKEVRSPLSKAWQRRNVVGTS